MLELKPEAHGIFQVLGHVFPLRYVFFFDKLRKEGANKFHSPGERPIFAEGMPLASLVLKLLCQRDQYLDFQQRTQRGWGHQFKVTGPAGDKAGFQMLL